MSVKFNIALPLVRANSSLLGEEIIEANMHLISEIIVLDILTAEQLFFVACWLSPVASHKLVYVSHRRFESFRKTWPMMRSSRSAWKPKEDRFVPMEPVGLKQTHPRRTCILKTGS